MRFTCPCVPGAGLSRRSGLGSAPVAPERLTQHLLRHVHARKKKAPALDSGASSARRGGGSRWTPRARRPSVVLGSGASSARRRGHMVAPTRFVGHMGGTLRRIPPVRPAHPLLTRLLGPNLTSLPRQILTATASLRSSRLQQAPVENLPVRPAHPLLTRLLGPNLTSLPRQILTATASLRSSRLQDHPPLARLALQLLAAPR